MADHTQMKKNRGDSWRTLLHSEWFISHLLSYLWIHDVAKLDSAICNHADRKYWLDHLNKSQSSLYANLSPASTTKIYEYVIDRMVEWVKLKRIQLDQFVINGSLLDKVIYISEHVFEDVISCHKNLKKLQFIELFRFTKKIDLNITHPLEDFLFQGFISDNSLNMLADCFYNLKYLNLDLSIDYENEEEDIDENNYGAFRQLSIQAILRKNEQLKSLYLKNVLLNSHILLTLGTCCPELEVFDLSVSEDDDDEIEFVVYKSEIQKFAQGCQYLKVFNIDYDISGDIDLFFEYFGQNNPFLELVGLSAIRDLNVTININTFVKFTKNCPLLKELRLAGVKLTTYCIESLKNNCLNIERLELHDCDLSIETLTIIGQFLKLKSIMLGGSTSITDKKINCLIESCKNGAIESFELRDSHKLSNAGLFQLSKLPFLKSIYLGYISDITDGAIAYLVSNLRKVEHIHIAYCPNISIVSLRHIAKHCPLLRSFEINLYSKSLYKNRAPDLSSGFQALVQNCPLLVELRSTTETPWSVYDSVPDEIKSVVNKRKKRG